MYGRGGRGCDGKNLETLRKVGEEAKRANRLLKRKYGLVKAWSHRSHPEHGRVLQAYLTAAREESVPRAHEMVEAIEKRMLVGLNPEKRLQLLNGLRSCTDSLEVKAEKIAADAAGE